MSTIILSGNVTKDASVRQTKSGKLLEIFTVAVPRRFKPEEADFVNVFSIVDSEENAVKKGESVRVSGYLNSYKNKAGQSRTVVNARSIIPVVQRKYRPNFAMVSGRLTKDAQASEIKGRWCLSFTIAENRGENQATFIHVEQWRKEEPKFTLHKGEYVMIMGNLRVSSCEKGGVWYENAKIVADDIETAAWSKKPQSDDVAKPATPATGKTGEEDSVASTKVTTEAETTETEMDMPDLSGFNLAGDDEVPF